MPGRSFTATGQTGYRYGFNGKENDNEVKGAGNSLDFGARIYDSRLGRWLSTDPLVAKYPFASPYNFVLNNPINAIDPDGRDIIFLTRNADESVKEQFKYRNGNFYHENGKRYNPGKEAISKTMFQVLTAYRIIESSNDKILKGQLHTLENSDQKHYVEKSLLRKNSVNDLISVSGANGIPTGTQTQLDFTVDKDDPLVTVTHEMRHQFDYEIGNMADAHFESSAKDPAEIRAVHNENKANDILGKKHRTTYGGVKIDPIKLDTPPNNKQAKDVRD